MASTPRPKRTDTNWLRANLVSEFQNLLDILDAEVAKAENSREQLIASFEKVKADAGAIMQELTADLQRLHEETIFLADRLRQKYEEKINSYSDDLDHKIKSITASIDRLTQNKSIFLAQKEMEYLQTSQDEVSKVQSYQTRTLAFKKSNMLLSLLRQLNTFGSIEVVCSGGEKHDKTESDEDKLCLPDPQALIDDYIKTSFPDINLNADDATPSAEGSAKPCLRDSNIASFPIINSATNYRNLTWEGKFRLVLSDKHKVTDACCLNSIAVLDNRFIAVCDSPHDCIQVFNGNYDLLEEIDCRKPRGLCTISKESFAVSLHEEPVVKFLSCQNSKFSWSNEMKVPCKSWVRDIKHVGKNMFLLCDDGDIHKTSLKGKSEAVFQTGLGKHQCRHLCVSKDISRLYVSGEESVICLDKEGKQIWKYCDPLAKTEGRGLALFDSHIFVSDWKNSSLIEMTEEGQVANVTKDIGYPYALYIVEGERFGKLFVTQFSRFVSRETRRCVHVYRVGRVNDKR